ncbi:hypothetical protein BAOM_5038 [Peribacillus asahii]|uniref:Uncharacterized protein n=1 Tax=Peribacillus asahii TaxID=228899 RepID=A0A3Q9RRG4_9BACI|nr:hypothetical protein BAOM_5038 [Peribacillus asahii]
MMENIKLLLLLYMKIFVHFRVEWERTEIEKVEKRWNQ